MNILVFVLTLQGFKVIPNICGIREYNEFLSNFYHKSVHKKKIVAEHTDRILIDTQ